MKRSMLKIASSNDGAFLCQLRVRAIANSITTAVNENTDAILKVSEGYTVSPDGTQIPKYVQQERIIQTQSMDVEDLAHLGFANQQGRFMVAYADGMIPAIRRGMQLGTTLIIIKPYGEDIATVWQVKKVIESYNDWVKVLIQDTGKAP
uniref:Head protein n=1 Tax=Acinetobacter phage vB_AbaM-SPB TaxID=3236747 RepID=A0AB39C8W5_9CAUD